MLIATVVIVIIFADFHHHHYLHRQYHCFIFDPFNDAIFIVIKYVKHRMISD
jgi:hypothetical protein